MAGDVEQLRHDLTVLGRGAIVIVEVGVETLEGAYQGLVDDEAVVLTDAGERRVGLAGIDRFVIEVRRDPGPE